MNEQNKNTENKAKVHDIDDFIFQDEPACVSEK